MTEKGPNTHIELYELSLHRTICNGRFISLKSNKTSVFKQIPISSHFSFLFFFLSEIIVNRVYYIF